MEGSEDEASDNGGCMVCMEAFPHRNKVWGVSHWSLSRCKFVYITWYISIFASLIFMLQVGNFPCRLYVFSEREIT